MTAFRTSHHGTLLTKERKREQTELQRRTFNEHFQSQIYLMGPFFTELLLTLNLERILGISMDTVTVTPSILHCFFP